MYVSKFQGKTAKYQAKVALSSTLTHPIGGTIYVDGDFITHYWDCNATDFTFTFVANQLAGRTFDASIFLIGGGGSGKSLGSTGSSFYSCSGGGGAGGVSIISASLTSSPDVPIVYNVGVGPGSYDPRFNPPYTRGGDSYLYNALTDEYVYLAYGGGNQENYTVYAPAPTVTAARGKNGGSGAGGGYVYTTGPYPNYDFATVSGTSIVGSAVHFGNDGAAGYFTGSPTLQPAKGGGGGGAGGAASNSTGGAGLTLNLTGTPIEYAHGGSGATISTEYTTPGSGGKGSYQYSAIGFVEGTDGVCGAVAIRYKRWW